MRVGQFATESRFVGISEVLLQAIAIDSLACQENPDIICQTYLTNNHLFRSPSGIGVPISNLRFAL